MNACFVIFLFVLLELTSSEARGATSLAERLAGSAGCFLLAHPPWLNQVPPDLHIESTSRSMLKAKPDTAKEKGRLSHLWATESRGCAGAGLNGQPLRQASLAGLAGEQK